MEKKVYGMQVIFWLLLISWFLLTILWHTIMLNAFSDYNGNFTIIGFLFSTLPCLLILCFGMILFTKN